MVSEKYYRHEYDELTADDDCDCAFLVAESDGKIVGYVFCLVDHEILDDPAEYVQVLDIVVTEPFRKQGLGKRLMAEVDRFAEEREIARISLMVLSANEDAVAFYRTLGFEVAVLTMERIR